MREGRPATGKIAVYPNDHVIPASEVDRKIRRSDAAFGKILHSTSRVKPIQQNSVSHAGWISGARTLESHESTVSGNHRVRRLSPFVVIEVREPSEVLSGSVEP